MVSCHEGKTRVINLCLGDIIGQKAQTSLIWQSGTYLYISEMLNRCQALLCVGSKKSLIAGCFTKVCVS